ncbi:IS91 family transposase [Anaerotalea alkaliphila]|uniref:Transposase n=1 Tax=Anaerotalea alkaliphila TaxID=2662126 RepID=A0A7X5KP31_9FIRM|nr:transposase [Anaerotalea alkaliphila]NDL68463.1 transposase [Anaerotalea alkaliphila]
MSKQSFKIKDIFADNWDSFLKEGYSIRQSVLDNVAKIIHCGDPSLGHALYYCDKCGNVKYVGFTCKSRFCNSCGSKYIQDRSLSISRKLIRCPHRHLVFTIPKELRIYFRKNRQLLNVLFEASSNVILSWFHDLNKSESFKPGFVSTLHTFGRDLKWNPHIHMLLTEGASGNFTVWRKVSHISFIALRKRWQAALLDILSKHLPASFYTLKTFLFQNYTDGFYVNAPRKDYSNPLETIKYIIRYTGRPAMAQSRILDYDGSYVTFYYDRHEDNQRVEETIPVFEFFKRLIIHIHDHPFKTIRYYGLYAKQYKHSRQLYPMLSPNQRKFYERHSDWRSRLLLAFNIDCLACSHCGNTMKLLDIFISDGTNPYLANAPPASYNVLSMH